MNPNFEGQYLDKKSGRVYEIKVNIQENSSAIGIVMGMTFYTACGLKASPITMNDNTQGMILDDKTQLTPL